MTFIPIAHKRCECIGCGLCTEAAPDYWWMNAHGEAELQTILRTHNKFEYGAGLSQDQARLQAAQDGCPVNIIRLG
jgi:ferredoxin